MAKKDIATLLAKRSAQECEAALDRDYNSLFGLDRSIENAEYAMISFDMMDSFPNHPFHTYSGQRKEDMIESIRENGVMQPLILRLTENGRYQILSGHNRMMCAVEAGLNAAQSIIKRDLNDEEALMYVIETNLMQRSFSDMTHSEKAAVLAIQHSKLFSQGKRNDIIEELRRLENPCEYGEIRTSPQVGARMRTDEKVGLEYSLSKNTVARYLRIHKLSASLKARLDSGEIGFIPAFTLSFMKEAEQTLLDKCVELNCFKVDMKKADMLRLHSEKGKLDEETICRILNGEMGQKPKSNRTPTVKVSKAVYAKYFRPDQPQKEVRDIVEKALDLYFTTQN